MPDSPLSKELVGHFCPIAECRNLLHLFQLIRQHGDLGFETGFSAFTAAILAELSPHC